MGQKKKEREKQQSNLKWLMSINMHKKQFLLIKQTTSLLGQNNNKTLFLSLSNNACYNLEITDFISL